MSTCSNCGEPAAREFCPACGQRVRDPRRPLFGFLGDFLSEFWSLDGKHIRTAVALLRPGRLTRLYLDGKRASYATPVRVYFVASLLFFLLVGLPAPDARETNVYINDVLIEREEPGANKSRFSLSFDRDSRVQNLIAPNLNEKIAAMQAMPAQEVLDRVFAELERTIPTALIALLPILALALKLVYWRTRRYYVEHLIFAIHFQSFLFLGLVLASVVNLGLRVWNPDFPSLLLYSSVILIVAPIYLVIAAKRIYDQSWGFTVLKCGALAFLYLFLMQPVLTVTFALVVSRA